MGVAVVVLSCLGNLEPHSGHRLHIRRKQNESIEKSPDCSAGDCSNSDSVFPRRTLRMEVGRLLCLPECGDSISEVIVKTRMNENPV